MAKQHLAPDLAAWVEDLFGGAGKAPGVGSGSVAPQPPAHPVRAARCAPTPIPAGAIEAMAMRLGASPAEVPIWRATIQTALDRADADYRHYRSMTSRSPLLRRLLRLQRLAADAARGRSGVFGKLIDAIGDGLQVDRDIDLALGLDGDDPVTRAGRVFASAPSASTAWILVDELQRARFARPRARARRGRKVFLIVGLALAYVTLTGKRATYATDTYGGRVSAFGSLCMAVDGDMGVDHDGKGLDRAIRDAVRITEREIALALAWRELGVAIRPARLGSAAFVEAA